MDWAANLRPEVFGIGGWPDIAAIFDKQIVVPQRPHAGHRVGHRGLRHRQLLRCPGNGIFGHDGIENNQ
jgi:hypothetical protein